MPVDVTKDLTIGIFGCGSLGSRLANTLAYLGVNMLLVDDDIVGEENIGYQEVYSIEDVGEYKVKALAKHLKERFLENKIVGYRTSIPHIGSYLHHNLDGPDKVIRSVVERSDIIITAFDSTFPRLTIFSYAIESGKRLVDVGIDNTVGVFKFWSGKKNDPCPICELISFNTSERQSYSINPLYAFLLTSISSYYIYKILLGHIDESFNLYIWFNNLKIEVYRPRKNDYCICSKDLAGSLSDKLEAISKYIFPDGELNER